MAGQAVDMRRTKLSAEDAALIAGELVKPSWASRNEGIHERISFDDTLWGFELAGGSYYKTPLRVVGRIFIRVGEWNQRTSLVAHPSHMKLLWKNRNTTANISQPYFNVKPGSRAEQACIRKGDTVLRINDIDTSTLTLQQAHDIVLESGIHLRIAVTSPDDDEDAYYSYQDEIDEAARLAEELRKAKEAERIRRAIERANRGCNLPWPWVRRKIIIYRESNCFLVPSSYESKHKEKYPELPHVRFTDDICEINRGTKVDPNSQKNKKDLEKTTEAESITNGNVDLDKSNDIDEKEQNKIIDEILNSKEDEVENQNIPSDIEETTYSDVETNHSDMNGEVLGPDSEEDGVQVIQNDRDKIDDVEEQIESNLEDRLAEKVVDSVDDKLDDNDRQAQNTLDDIEGDTNENDVPTNKEENIEHFEDELEELEENQVIDEDKDIEILEDNILDKAEEDNVVDHIVGDGIDDSINER